MLDSIALFLGLLGTFGLIRLSGELVGPRMISRPVPYGLACLTMIVAAVALMGL